MNESSVVIEAASLRAELEKLKAAGFNLLVDLTAVDYSAYGKGTASTSPAPSGKRFKLVYRLMDLDTETGLPRARLTADCWLDGEKAPPSVRDLWANADWLEREAWDMFGVRFADRPDIKRLLMYEQFVGHPLRKDYPLNKRQPLIGPKDEKPRERMLEGDLRPKVT